MISPWLYDEVGEDCLQRRYQRPTQGRNHKFLSEAGEGGLTEPSLSFLPLFSPFLTFPLFSRIKVALKSS